MGNRPKFVDLIVFLAAVVFFVMILKACGETWVYWPLR